MSALKESKWLITSLILLPVLLLALFMIFILQDDSKNSEVAKDPQDAITTVEDFSGDFSDIPDANVTVDRSGSNQLTENAPPPADVSVITEDSSSETTVTEKEASSSGAADNNTYVAPPAKPTITTKPRKITNSKTITFALSGDGKFYCSLNKREGKPCSSKTVYKNLGNGEYLFSSWQVTAGGKSEINSYAFTIDRKSPGKVQIISAPNSFTNQKNATFRFRGETNASYRCKLNGKNKTRCSSPKTYRGLADGKYSFYVWQIDEAGNRSENTKVNFTVDRSPPPAPTILSSEVGPDSFTVIFQNDGYQIFCSLNEEFRACSEITTFQDLDPGNYTLSFYQKDDSENTSPLANYSFTIEDIGVTSKRMRSRAITRNSPSSMNQAASEDVVGIEASVSVASALQLRLDGTSDFEDTVSDQALEALDVGVDSESIAFLREVDLRSNATWNIDLETSPLVKVGGGSILMIDTDASGLPNTNNAYQVDKDVSAAGSVDWSVNAGNYTGTSSITATNGY